MTDTQRAAAGSTTQQLKHDIDTGRTGSKVPVVDPGLSPLGTDDEAAGTPPRPHEVAAAREAERRIGETARANDRPRSFAPAAWMIVLIAALAAVVVIAYMMNR